MLSNDECGKDKVRLNKRMNNYDKCNVIVMELVDSGSPKEEDLDGEKGGCATWYMPVTCAFLVRSRQTAESARAITSKQSGRGATCPATCPATFCFGQV